MNLISIFILYPLGCSGSMQNPPATATIAFTPEEYEFSWSAEENAIDRAGRLFAFDIVVTDSNNRFGSMPLPHTKVEIISLHDGVYLIPQEAIELVSYPGLPGDVQSIQDVREQCQDEFGNYSHAAGDWCAWYWETSSNMFYQFTNTYADAYLYSEDTGFCGEDNAPCEYFYGPTYWVTETDSRGLIRGYAMVDNVVDEANGTEVASGGQIDIFATIGYTSATLTLNAGGGTASE